MSVFGTAREAFENYQYNQLVERYDKHTADKLIERQLNKVGLTLQDFDTYRTVKKHVQNGALNVSHAEKEAKDLANAIFD